MRDSPAELDRDWLGRVCHLSEADLAVIRRRTDPVTQLGYAAQLVTVRAIGTFQSDPAAVPEPVVATIARQLGIDDPGALAAYRGMPVRWRYAAEIRDRCGYRDFAAQPGRFAFTAWLYRQAWADEVAPSVLFRAAHRQLLARQILLPGQSVLTRLIATVRKRATHRVHAGWRERPTRSCGPGWRNSCSCPKGSAAPNWTCCAARRSRLQSPGWCAPWTGLTASGSSAPVTWTCPGYRPRGSWRWPATPTRPGPPSWLTWALSGGSPP